MANSVSDPGAAARQPGGALAHRLGAAAALMSLLVLGPALLLAAHAWLRPPVAAGQLDAWTRELRLWLPVSALLLFASGWVLAGTAARPRGSRWLGALGGAALYLLAGFGWWTAAAMRYGHDPLALWAGVAREPLALFHVCQWPIHAADAAGILGFRLG